MSDCCANGSGDMGKCLGVMLNVLGYIKRSFRLNGYSDALSSQSLAGL